MTEEMEKWVKKRQKLLDDAYFDIRYILDERGFFIGEQIALLEQIKFDILYETALTKEGPEEAEEEPEEELDDEFEGLEEETEENKKELGEV
ncbi:MAG: hypothetical protein ACTSV7_14975 [Candidatus Baldrarchaeia archaeon]